MKLLIRINKMYKHIQKYLLISLFYLSLHFIPAGQNAFYSQELGTEKLSITNSLVKEGDSAYRIGRYEEAIKLYKSAISEDATLMNDQSVTLKRAMCAYHSGDYETARTMLTRAKDLDKVKHDYIDYFISQCTMALGELETAAESFSTIPNNYSASLVKEESSYYAGYLFHFLERFSESNRMLRPLENSRTVSAGRTGIRYYVGVNFLHSGNEADGVSRLLRIMSSSPSDTFALKAAENINTLRKNSGTDLTERETMLMASVYNSHEKFDEAQVLITEYFKRFQDGEYIGRAHFERGRINFSKRGYRDATADFNKAFSLLKEPKLIRESRLYIARSLSRSGDRAGAEREYDRFARDYPSDRMAAESLWINALNYERRGEFLKAAEEYQKVAQKKDPNEYRDRALFRVGFCWYKNDYLTKSSRYFNNLQKEHPGTELALQAAFWEAKALEKLGKTEEARAIYNSLAQRKERSYYVVTVRDRIGFDTQFEQPEELLEMAAIPDELRDVAEIGLIFGEPWGSRELQRHRRNLSGSKESLSSLAGLYRALVETGTFNKAVQTADLLYNRYYYGSNNMDVLRALYPRHYSELLQDIPDARRVEESLIFSIMRRESLFGLNAVSSSGAIGLMQLMPATANSLARSMEMSGFNVADVKKPDVNMKLGIRNIRELMQRFRGNMPLVIAAYNAGDAVVRTWIKRHGTKDMDEFIENIEYSETRAFVKEVLKSYYYYNHLYPETLSGK